MGVFLGQTDGEKGLLGLGLEPFPEARPRQIKPAVQGHPAMLASHPKPHSTAISNCCSTLEKQVQAFVKAAGLVCFPLVDSQEQKGRRGK